LFRVTGYDIFRQLPAMTAGTGVSQYVATLNPSLNKQEGRFGLEMQMRPGQWRFGARCRELR
jgi:hypothetical protein